MKTISIIIPVYNCERYLRKCLDSVLAQTYKRLEVILIDDGSTDCSGEICDEYARQDSRVKVVHQTNAGSSKARNVALEMAQGDYIGFIDSDDYVAPDMFELLQNNIEKEDADVSMCGAFDCYEGQKPKILKSYYGVMDGEHALKMILENKIVSVHPWNKLFKADVWKNTRYPEHLFCAVDAWAIVEAVLKCSKAVVTSEQKYYYYHREGSITNKSFGSKDFNTILAYKHNYKVVTEKYPRLAYVSKYRLAVAYYSTLDKLYIYGDDVRVRGGVVEKCLVRKVRKTMPFLLFCKYVNNKKKLAFLALLVNKNLYAYIEKKHVENVRRAYK